MTKKIIYLTGFMASGKSTIGPILANTIGWDFIDMDREIEKREGKLIKDIFKDDGEAFFRKIEHKCLSDLSNFENYVIALGGGTIANQTNLDLIKSSGLLIYLESSPEEYYKRLRFKRDRPALLFEGDEEPTKEEFLDRINKMLNARIKFYDQANFKINTDNSYVGKTVDKIVSFINKEMYGKANKS